MNFIYLFFKVKTCTKCQKTNPPINKSAPPLHSIPIEPEVWKQVGIDLIGPLPVTAKGNKYIVTLSDYFSKWPEAQALPDKTALGVAEFLYKVKMIINSILFTHLYFLHPVYKIRIAIDSCVYTARV